MNPCRVEGLSPQLSRMSAAQRFMTPTVTFKVCFQFRLLRRMRNVAHLLLNMRSVVSRYVVTSCRVCARGMALKGCSRHDRDPQLEIGFQPHHQHRAQPREPLNKGRLGCTWVAS